MHVCMHVSKYLYVCMHVSKYLYVCILMYVYVYVCYTARTCSVPRQKEISRKVLDPVHSLLL